MLQLQISSTSNKEPNKANWTEETVKKTSNCWMIWMADQIAQMMWSQFQRIKMKLKLKMKYSCFGALATAEICIPLKYTSPNWMHYNTFAEDRRTPCLKRIVNAMSAFQQQKVLKINFFIELLMRILYIEFYIDYLENERSFDQRFN